MNRPRVSLAATFIILAFTAPAAAQSTPTDAPPHWEDLTDEPSRRDLSEYEMQNFAPPGEKAIRRAFAFPADANDGDYGIDVSHHNGVIAWPTVAASSVRFVYIKATQGMRFRDSKFATNWAGAATGLRRGAYHFLSAERGTGAAQARAFIALLTASGGLRDSDLAPVLDMEWDLAKVNGVQRDRWESLTPDEIATEALAWLRAVEAATGRKPIIYTAASWWTPRLRSNAALNGYTHWIADYRQSSIAAGAPKSVTSIPFAAWQFTDVGKFGSVLKRVDVNRIRSGGVDSLSGKPTQ